MPDATPDTPSPPTPTPPATTRYEQFLHVVDTSSPLTRNAIALALIYGFIHLSFAKEISGDSFTNVIFVIVGYFFGKSDLPRVSPTGNGNGNGTQTH